MATYGELHEKLLPKKGLQKAVGQDLSKRKFFDVEQWAKEKREVDVSTPVPCREEFALMVGEAMNREYLRPIRHIARRYRKRAEGHMGTAYAVINEFLTEVEDFTDRKGILAWRIWYW
jgi:hypothetical protein